MIDADSSIMTDRLKLEIIQEGDIEDVFETMNSKNTAEMVSFLRWPMTMEQAGKWCQKSVHGFKNSTDYLFIGRDKHKSQNIGLIGIHIQDNSHIAEIGYWVSEKYQSKGYASELTKAVVNYATQNLGMQKLFATVAHNNIASARVLEKTGFMYANQIDVPLPDGSVRISALYEFKKEYLD